MRLSTMLIAAATATCSLSALAAPAASADVNAKMVAVQTIQGESGRHATPDAATLAGLYPLSNGEVLHVSYERHRLFAEMGARKTELVPTGATSFAGRGTSLQFVFDQVPFATDVVISSR